MKAVPEGLGQTAAQVVLARMAGVEGGVATGPGGIRDRRAAGRREQVQDGRVLRSTVNADAGDRAEALGIEVDDKVLVGGKAEPQAGLRPRMQVGFGLALAKWRAIFSPSGGGLEQDRAFVAQGRVSPYGIIEPVDE
ncbi:hypothetical protein, partial [Niveispirillum sp. SYP-B3756]|uniref:hypothetical protein n=1 Tax=Niveispirillum sp. SYP-B3756 TaxID=2662178 RepID=UPI001B3BFA24